MLRWINYELSQDGKEAAFSSLFKLWLLISFLVLWRRGAVTPLFHEDNTSEENLLFLDYREHLGKDISSVSPTHPLFGIALHPCICSSDL